MNILQQRSPIVAQYTLKRGDTFAKSWGVTDGGAPADLTGWTARSQARLCTGELVQDFVVSLDVVNSKVAIVAPYADTEVWPIATLYGDVEITNGADRRSTITFAIHVEQDWTRPA